MYVLQLSSQIDLMEKLKRFNLDTEKRSWMLRTNNFSRKYFVHGSPETETLKLNNLKIFFVMKLTRHIF